jgi:hypothetical protein
MAANASCIDKQTVFVNQTVQFQPRQFQYLQGKRSLDKRSGFQSNMTQRKGHRASITIFNQTEDVRLQEKRTEVRERNIRGI